MRLIATHYPNPAVPTGMPDPMVITFCEDSSRWCWTEQREAAHEFDSEKAAMRIVDQVAKNPHPSFTAWYDRANVVVEGSPRVGA